jgi:hypothetical protein
MQGFLFSRPLPPDQLADLLRPTPRLVSPPLQPAAGSDPDQSSVRQSGPAMTARQATY